MGARAAKAAAGSGRRRTAPSCPTQRRGAREPPPAPGDP